MKIYVGHSKDIDYVNNLYKPIRKLELEANDKIFLPHEEDINHNNSREFYSDIDLFIAEVSYPSTGLGIELGIAYLDKVPIVCISQKGKNVSFSLKFVTNKFYEYEGNEDLKKLINKIIIESRRQNDR